MNPEILASDIWADVLAVRTQRPLVHSITNLVVMNYNANFLLAILLYWAVFIYGSNELLPILGTPPAGSPAAMAAIHNGEQVRAVDGQAVTTWNDLRWMILQKAVDQPSVELEVINEQNEVFQRQLPLEAAGEKGWEGDALERLGVNFYRPNAPPVIGKLVSGGPAERAGLEVGDRVLAIDASTAKVFGQKKEVTIKTIAATAPTISPTAGK